MSGISLFALPHRCVPLRGPGWTLLTAIRPLYGCVAIDGDGLIEGDDIYGDGVNIAARLEPFAESGLRTLSWIVRRSFRCSQAILVFVIVGVFLDLLLLFHAR
jgi:hypothetical protein